MWGNCFPVFFSLSDIKSWVQLCASRVDTWYKQIRMRQLLPWSGFDDFILGQYLAYELTRNTWQSTLFGHCSTRKKYLASIDGAFLVAADASIIAWSDWRITWSIPVLRVLGSNWLPFFLIHLHHHSVYSAAGTTCQPCGSFILYLLSCHLPSFPQALFWHRTYLPSAAQRRSMIIRFAGVCIGHVYELKCVCRATLRAYAGSWLTG